MCRCWTGGVKPASEIINNKEILFMEETVNEQLVFEESDFADDQTSKQIGRASCRERVFNTV